MPGYWGHVIRFSPVKPKDPDNEAAAAAVQNQRNFLTFRQFLRQFGRL